MKRRSVSDLEFTALPRARFDALITVEGVARKDAEHLVKPANLNLASVLQPKRKGSLLDKVLEAFPYFPVIGSGSSIKLVTNVPGMFVELKESAEGLAMHVVNKEGKVSHSCIGIQCVKDVRDFLFLHSIQPGTTLQREQTKIKDPERFRALAKEM